MEAESTAGYFLSPQQSHQWLLQQRSETRGSAQIAVLLEGEVDESRLRDALRRVVARHEILRTVFRRRAGMKTPFQVIQEASEPEWKMNLGSVSVSDAEDEEAVSLLRSQAALKFDYELGPTTHALLTRISASKYIFTITIPALCADSSSLRTLVSECSPITLIPVASLLRSRYAIFSLPSGKASYSRVKIAQRWKEGLSGSNWLNLVSKTSNYRVKSSRDRWRGWCGWSSQYLQRFLPRANDLQLVWILPSTM